MTLVQKAFIIGFGAVSLFGADSAFSQEASAWATQCISTSRASPVDCVAVHQIRTDTNQVVFEVSISTRQGQSGGKLNLRAPLGFYLPAGVQLAQGDQTLQEFRIDRCATDGCYASIDLDADALASIAQATELSLQFKAQADADLTTIPLPVNGLPDALSLIGE